MNTTDFSDIGGLAFFFTYLGDCLPFVIITSIGVILGIIGKNS